MTYDLHLDNGGRLCGTAADSVGLSSIEGSIDSKTQTIRFLKTYDSFKLLDQKLLGGLLSMCGLKTQWEYTGEFTTAGVEGSWHYPGRLNSTSCGTFTMWLSEDHRTLEQVV